MPQSDLTGAEKMPEDDVKSNESGVQRKAAEFLTPPNRLKRMAAMPGGKSLSEMVAASEDVVADLTEEFVDRSTADIAHLRRLISDLAESLGDPHSSTDEIYAIGARLTGVAGTFDYPLVTAMGTSLIDFVLGLTQRGQNVSSDPRYDQVIELHLGSMELVLSQKIEGQGGAAELQMIEGLHKAVAKLSL